MRKLAVVEKELGETPLQALERFRSADAAFADVKMTYAGRLDPMATGKLLILIGEECKRREQYLKLDKEYEFEILLGMSSDTGDVLGLASMSEVRLRSSVDGADMRAAARSIVGAHELPYPAYSSKTVKGKPLFRHALEGGLDAIEIPRASARVYEIGYGGSRSLSGTELRAEIANKLSSLRAPRSDRLGSDFRLDRVHERWDELIGEAPRKQFAILSFKARVSSGTYIRSLAPLIAQKLGASGLAYSIHRTEIGRYRSLGPFS